MALSLLVALGGVVPFLPTLGAAFLADDWFFVAAYRDATIPVRTLVWRALTSLEGTPTTFYRPVPFVSLALQLRASDSSAWSLHVVNLGLHGLSAALLFVLVRRLVRGRAVVALLATLAFAWFPRRTEPVAWLSCRPDLLAALGAIASVVLFEAFLRTRRRWWAAGSLAAWWLALLSKESALLLPLVHLALAANHSGRASASSEASAPPHSPPWAAFWPVSWLWPFAASVPAYLVLRRLVVGAWVGGYGAGVLAVGASTASSAVKHLAYQLIPPLAWLDGPLRSGSATLAVTLLVAVLVALVGLAVWLSRDHPAARVGMAWVVAGVLPVITLPVSLSTTFNDRLLYFPACGAALVLGAWLDRTRGRALWLIVFLACASSAVWSWQLSQRWARAGDLTARSVAGLGRALADEAAPRVYLAALPDSLGGAYMLRNGVRDALRLSGLTDPDRVVPLAWYFVDPDDDTGLPLDARLEGPLSIRLDSRGPLPEVMAGTREAEGLVTYQAEGGSDRFGRRVAVRVQLRQPGPVWMVTPGGVTRLSP